MCIVAHRRQYGAAQFPQQSDEALDLTTTRTCHSVHGLEALVRTSGRSTPRGCPRRGGSSPSLARAPTRRRAAPSYASTATPSQGGPTSRAPRIRGLASEVAGEETSWSQGRERRGRRGGNASARRASGTSSGRLDFLTVEVDRVLARVGVVDEDVDDGTVRQVAAGAGGQSVRTEQVSGVNAQTRSQDAATHRVAHGARALPVLADPRPQATPGQARQATH